MGTFMLHMPEIDARVWKLDQIITTAINESKRISVKASNPIHRSQLCKAMQGNTINTVKLVNTAIHTNKPISNTNKPISNTNKPITNTNKPITITHKAKGTDRAEAITRRKHKKCSDSQRAMLQLTRLRQVVSTVTATSMMTRSGRR